jgi:hypothetical protein
MEEDMTDYKPPAPEVVRIETPVSTSTKSGTALIILAFVFGGLLALAGLVLPHVPVAHGESVSDAHNLCHSGFGLFARSMDKGAERSCSNVDKLYAAGWVTLVVGVLLLASGAFAILHRKRR